MEMPKLKGNPKDISMRIDKLTTKFQEALGEAQTLALGHDHAYIEPAHVLSAMLRQDDGPKALLQRSGANGAGLLTAAQAANAGDYTGVGTNSMSSVTSAKGTLTVNAVVTPPTPAPSSDGGGGGAPSLWFLAAMGASRMGRRRQQRRSP